MMVSLGKKIRAELWGFCALAGLFSIHTGIVLSVFAIKDVTSHPTLLKIFGIVLIIAGVFATIASWFFHRQKREKRPLCPCVVRCCACCAKDRDGNGGRPAGHGEDNRRKSSKKENAIAPATSTGFSALEFKVYADYLKHDIHGVEGYPCHKAHKGANARSFVDKRPSSPDHKEEPSSAIAQLQCNSRSHFLNHEGQ